MPELRALVLSLVLVGTPALAQQADAPMFDRMVEADANRDGVITRAELIASRTASFARFDRNRDGVITNGDVPAFMRGSALGQRFAAMIAEFDADRDGKVTRAELTGAPTPLFDRADRNRDNQVTRAELDAAKAQAGR